MLRFIVSSGQHLPVRVAHKTLLDRIQECNVQAQYLPCGDKPSIEVSGTENEVELKPCNCRLHNVITPQDGEKRYDAEAVLIIRPNSTNQEITYRFFVK